MGWRMKVAVVAALGALAVGFAVLPKPGGPSKQVVRECSALAQRLPTAAEQSKAMHDCLVNGPPGGLTRTEARPR